jgi:hypothetical protein
VPCGEAEGLAVAEADFQHARRMAAEHRVEIAPRAGVIEQRGCPSLT